MTTESSVRGLHTSERLYAALLWAMPDEYRQAHSRDAVETFRDLYRDAMTRGGFWAVARLWRRSLLHAIGCAARERWEALVGRHRRPTRPRLNGPNKTRSTGNMFETLLQDVRFAIRSFANKPGFSLMKFATVMPQGADRPSPCWTLLQGSKRCTARLAPISATTLRWAVL